MYQIKKLRDDNVLHFAAEELKKYLRMMMPDCGEIEISTDPDAKDGFRLGLLEDFALPCEAADATLDDIVHIDTTAEGGILAGSNPRSVLFAVYRLLKENGCRFLFPGTDGEYIPRKTVEAVSYHKQADHRLRGHTTEGSPSLEQALQYIDYQAKQELNIYSLFEIFPYHRRYYCHKFNAKNRLPEPVDRELVDQWKALCEAEVAKRGMQIHDGGHGWVDQAVGLDRKDRYKYKFDHIPCPEHIRPSLAMLNGVRDLNKHDPAFTNICMSRKDLRQKVVDRFVEHCRSHPQSTYVKLALADTSHNYCECEECKKLRPSDYYVILLNEIDEQLTREGLPNRIIAVCYVDCMFAPSQERLKNPSRFLLQYCPLGVDYLSSVNAESVIPPTKPFIYNGWARPKTAEEALSYFKEWLAVYDGPSLSYGYHYWKPQYRDPGMMAFSRRIYEDILAIRYMGTDGCTEDGSNKSFFPNGFVDHIYGATLWNRELDYDAEQEDYFSHIYGPDWKMAKAYLQKITDAFDPVFMFGRRSADYTKGEYYNPARVKNLEQVKEITAEAREFIKTHLAMPTRPQTVSWRLLWRHAEYVERFAEILIEVCKGHSKYAMEMFMQFADDFGKYELEMDRYFDFELAFDSLYYVVKNVPKMEF